MSDNSLNVLINKVIEWSTNRRIIAESSSKAQFIKLVEEVGEIYKGLISVRDNRTNLIKVELGNTKELHEVMDGIGDSMVVAINIAALEGLDLSNTDLSITKLNFTSIDDEYVNQNTDMTSFHLGNLAGDIARGRDVTANLIDFIKSLAYLSQSLGLDLVDSLEQAYLEIKDRKGLMINGSFIKEADLTDEQKEEFKGLLLGQ